ncbi:DAL1B protein, partial [Campylorhamphus procurvoides]|nr:DAL1B protein [Campylorhamphus procurvoides]
VKAGSMRVSKKQENGAVEKTIKPPGKEKSRYCTAGSVPPALQLNHKMHAAALQVAHQKPQPTLEKFILPK